MTGTPAAREQMRYLAGAGIHGQQTISGGTPAAPVFLHGDLTGSTMLTTDAAGAAVASEREPTGRTPVGDRCHRVGGAGMHGQETVSGGQPQTPVFLHGDLTGSTMLTTDAGGAAVASVREPTGRTPVRDRCHRVGWAGAVGVPPASFGTRYQYDGGYGYESGLLAVAGPNTSLAPITLQHVGARWYQPGIGRFIQRDPIGIEGGMNCYLYCDAGPVVAVDPAGLMSEAAPSGRTYLGPEISDTGGVITGVGSAVMLGGLKKGNKRAVAGGGVVVCIGGIFWGVGSAVSLVERHITGPLGPVPAPPQPRPPLTPEQQERELRRLRTLPHVSP